MNDTLKAAGRIGAELGAAKAELERLREALETCESWFTKHSPTAPLIGGFGDAEHPMITFIRAALSQQAEPVCRFCGKPSGDCDQSFPHPSEPAPAQDEQEVAAVIGFYEGEREPRLLSWNVLPNGEHRLYARPAQAEQQPVSWQFYQDGKWWNGDDRIKDHRKNTEAAGIPVRNEQ